MSDFNGDVNSIMALFHKVDDGKKQENRWKGATPDGDIWVASLMPSKKELVVILNDKEKNTNKTIRIKENEREKLFSTFRDMYGIDSRMQNKESLNEDTVYDHSWYEVKGGKYPKRTKEGVIIKETASCGATCAGCVPSTPKPFAKISKRKRKKVSEDVDSILFKESILNDMPCESTINNHKFKYFMNEGKWYMAVDNNLVKTYDKNVMMETFDQIVDELPITTNLLEDYSCYEMDLLMEEDDAFANPTEYGTEMTSNPTDTSSSDSLSPGDNAVDSVSQEDIVANIGTEINQLNNEDDSAETMKSSDDIAKEESHNQEILGSENQEGTIQTKDGGSIDITIGKTDTIKDKNGQDIDVTHYKDKSGKDMITKTENISKKEF